MKRYFLFVDSIPRVVVLITRCGLRDHVGDPWQPGAIVLDDGVLRSVRMDQLIATEEFP